MHPDLVEVIQYAKTVRERVMDKSIPVREANAVNAANHLVLSAHALHLRERMFSAETAVTIAAVQNQGERAISAEGHA
jgi:hypothetical protein